MISQQDAFGTRSIVLISTGDSASNEMLPRPGEAEYQIQDQHQVADCVEGGCSVAQNVHMACRPCPSLDNQGCCWTRPPCGMRIQDRRMLREDGQDHCTLGVGVNVKNQCHADAYSHVLTTKL